MVKGDENGIVLFPAVSFASPFVFCGRTFHRSLIPLAVNGSYIRASGTDAPSEDGHSSQIDYS